MTYSKDAEDGEHEPTDQGENELFERRHNEIELIRAAYTPDEVWVSNHDGRTPTIVRRLLIKQNVDESSKGETSTTIALDLCVSMPLHYPMKESLCIESLTVAEERLGDRPPSSRLLLKAAYNAIPDVILHCREVADSCLGEESVWMVFAAVDDWMASNRHRFDVVNSRDIDTSDDCDVGCGSDVAVAANAEPALRTVTLGRRLIYSHHIIAKSKRADLATLFREFDLTGFVKVGWPGLILIEGVEESCQSFYDVIKRWSWQYLVVRGEMQEQALVDEKGQLPRLLPSYTEVNDLSVISQHCQSVGLEALFRTLLRVYDAPATTPEPNNEPAGEGSLYGVLVHVDHMNDGRSYRKWLRKTCQQLDVCLMIKECHAGTINENSATRIIVVLVGDELNVRNVLKKWRTSRVDIDSRGKPCLERMLTILHESYIERSKAVDRIDWDALSAEALLAMSFDDASHVLASIGGSTWVELLSTLVQK